MRFATVSHDGAPRLAVASPQGWRTATRAKATMLELIAGEQIDFDGPVLETEKTDVLLPYRPPTIIGIGLNYHDTVQEMGWEIPAAPYLFPKLSSSAVGPTEDIVVDLSVTTRADWEAELAVVIGRQCRNVAAEEALEVVFGYTAANDISARDLQAQDGQWVRGKGIDTYCPLGPAVVTAEEVHNPQDIGIRTWVNGTLMQDGTSVDMIFGVAELIAYCSRYFTLHPGDIILTGTPAGCGDFRSPPIALRPGDVVEVEVEHIGALRNTVVAPDAGQASPTGVVSMNGTPVPVN